LTKTVIELSPNEARKFFLKQESYCKFDLPQYFNFSNLLYGIDNLLQNISNFGSYLNGNPKYYEHVNHIILGNKDGKYAWRPLQLIHPAIYVNLVHNITKEENWNYIKNKFREFAKSEGIKCLSIPVVSDNKKRRDKAEQISTWWKKVEQESIKLSLDYDYIFNTDITDCYGSVYTHSIGWALHGREECKKDQRNLKLIGNFIDTTLRGMNYGQTNGIPQGNVLSDFIAEMILGYADRLLSDDLNKKSSDNYCILRYRDDYRIFVNNLQVGEKILKTLSEKLFILNFKLNPDKTISDNDIILSSIKKDKMAWLELKDSYSNFQKELLIIYKFSKLYPNSGSLVRLLNNFYDKVEKNSKNLKRGGDVEILISILTGIMHENPRTIPVCVAIMSILFEGIPKNKNKKELIEKIRKKFQKIPNIGLLEIWLQRLTYKIDTNIEYDEKLCKRVKDNSVKIWDSKWLKGSLKDTIDTGEIVKEEKLGKMSETISKNEFDIFEKEYFM